MKPFSWELQGVVGSGKRGSKVNTSFAAHKTHIVTTTSTYRQTRMCSSTNAHGQTTQQEWKRGNTQREMSQSPTARFLYDRTLYRSVQYAASAGTDLRIARDTFCFQGLSLRMPMPKPERKNSSPVVTRSHFCEASNSSTAESQMKACSLLLGQGEGRRVGRMGGYGATVQ